METRRIGLREAKELITEECKERPPSWLDSAEWFDCTLDSEDFRRLLVYNGGRPYSGWQEFANGSYEIADVATGLRTYTGTNEDLLRNRNDVLKYEKMMESGQLPERLCLVRSKGGDRITLFETNRRAVAMYLHYFINSRAQYRAVKGVLGELDKKLTLQSQ